MFLTIGRRQAPLEQRWVQQQFGGLSLGGQRRNARALALTAAMLRRPSASLERAGTVGRELLLRKALDSTGRMAARSSYDYILVDPPPSLGLFTLNALAAADAVIVPLQLHAYAFKALPQLEATIDLVRELNPPLHIGGIVCTLADRRTTLSQAVEAQVRAQYPELVFRTVIPINTKVAETPAVVQPVSAYAPASTGALAYAQLCAEVEHLYART